MGCVIFKDGAFVGGVMSNKAFFFPAVFVQAISVGEIPEYFKHSYRF